MPFPPPVDPTLWDVTEITDPDEAPNGGTGYLKAVFGQMPEAEGYTLRHALFGAAPNKTQPQVHPGTTYITTVGKPKDTRIEPKLYWRETATGAMELAGSKGPIVIKGLDEDTTIDPPMVVGELPDVLYRQGSGPQFVDAAPVFAGDDLVLTLVDAPAGVAISDGVVRTETDDVFTGAITVRASNSVGAADETFLARVMAAPTVVASLPDVTWQEDTGSKTVQAALAFSGEDLNFAITDGPGSIDAITGDVTFSTSDPISDDVTVEARNPVGSVSETFRVTVREGGDEKIHRATSVTQVVGFMSVNPGEIIELVGGTHSDSLMKSNISKAAPGVTIRAADPANRPRLLTNGGGARLVWNKINGFTIDGFIFETTEKDSAGYPWGNLIETGDCSPMTFRNCTFRGGRFQLRPKGKVDNLIVEWCEFDNCQQGFFESFAGGGPVTLRNNWFHGDNPNSAVMRQDGRHPDGTQFGAKPWRGITIENNRYDFRKEGFNCHFFGGTTFTDVTIRRNWYTSGDLNTVRLSGISNLLYEDNLIEDAPGHRRANVRIDGSRVTGIMRRNASPRQWVTTGDDQTTKSDNLIGGNARPPRWEEFDVARGKFGPYKQ